MSYWEIAARLAEESGAEVNWDEEYFVCPHCEDLVFSDDWIEADMKDDDCIVCPICLELMCVAYAIEEVMHQYH